MSEKMFCVYCHTSPSGKRYVGITSQNPIDRWQNGLGYRYNPHFFRAIMKYGWDNISHEILLTGLSEQQAKDKEIEYIAAFSSNDSNFGYNMTVGGDGCNGTKRSPETVQKLRAACRGWHHTKKAKEKISERAKEMWRSQEYRDWYSQNRCGENHPLYGKRPKQESIEKVRAANLGRKHTEEWIRWAKERFSGDRNPNYGKKYGPERLEQMRRIATERMKDPEERKHLRDCFPRKMVAQYGADGALIDTFDGIHEAARRTGVPASNISLCCRGNRKTAGGFHWEFAGEGELQ